MLSVNEQTELEVLLDIEEPNQIQQSRIEYLQNKKDSTNKMKSFKPVDIDSMECKCLNCFLKTLPEHSKNELLTLEINRYFDYKSKHNKYNHSLKPEVAAMRKIILDECKITKVFESNFKSPSDIITIDKVIHKYKENKLSREEIKKINEDSEFIRGVYEVCLFIIKTQIEIAKRYKLRSLIAIQSYYMTVDLMFIILDDLNHEPSWDLVDIIHSNMVNGLNIVSKLADLVPNELLHSNCKPTKEDFLDMLKDILNEK